MDMAMDQLPVAWANSAKSSNFTADIYGSYVITATCTVTDPTTPAEGKGFICFIRNGTATIGGTAYSQAGTVVYRLYHSGAWSNAVLPAISGAYTWTGQQTFTQPILTAAGSASLPSHSFSGDPDTGIYSSGTNQLGIACGGVLSAFAQVGTWNVINFGNQGFFNARRANGSESSPTQVLNGEVFGEFRATGYQGAGAYSVAARVFATAREDFAGASNLGCSLSFITTAIGSGSGGVRWRINPSGEFVRGDNDSIATFAGATTPCLQLLSTTGNTCTMGQAIFSNDGNPSRIQAAKSRGASVGTYTATSSGDDLLRISAQGVDTTATAFRESAVILFEQDAAGGASAVPGRVSIHTATSGGTVTEAMRVDSGQGVQIRSSMSTTSPGAGQTLTRGLQVDEQTITTTGAIAALASDTGVLRLTGAAPDVQGITAPTLGDRVLIVWATNATTLRHENAGASAANRITCSTGADITLAAGRSIMLWYDSTSTRWRNLAQAA